MSWPAVLFIGGMWGAEQRLSQEGMSRVIGLLKHDAPSWLPVAAGPAPYLCVSGYAVTYVCEYSVFSWSEAVWGWYYPAYVCSVILSCRAGSLRGICVSTCVTTAAALLLLHTFGCQTSLSLHVTAQGQRLGLGDRPMAVKHLSCWCFLNIFHTVGHTHLRDKTARCRSRNWSFWAFWVFWPKFKILWSED